MLLEINDDDVAGCCQVLVDGIVLGQRVMTGSPRIPLFLSIDNI